MKLHSLEITAMGPYPERVVVDFDRLDEAGVYLLTGPTGSGKTTVLDAVAYALFGEIPRAAKGAEVVSDHRRIETSPEVRLEVTIGEERLRITRVPEHLRKAARGDGTAKQAQSVIVEVHREGEWQTVPGNWRELNAELIERIGMNADQFGQVVMLPQGEFAKFLRATVNERKELLERLFPGTDLAWLEGWLRQRAGADRKAREAKQDEIEECFQRVQPIAASLVDSPADDDESEEDPPAILPDLAVAGPALEWVESKASELEKIAAEAGEARARAAEEATRAEGHLTGLRERANLVSRRAQTEAKLLELESRAAWRDEVGGQIEAAEKAARVKALQRSAQEQREAADRSAQALEEAKAAVGANALTSAVETERLAETERELRATATTVAVFESEELPKRRQLDDRLVELQAELERLRSTGADSPVGRAEAALTEAEASSRSAAQTLIEIRNSRTAGMAAELARGLEDGQPCVVCGSTEHPSPAHDGELRFTPEDEQRAEERAREASEAAGRASSHLASVRAETEQKQISTSRQIEETSKQLEGIASREKELVADAASVGDRRAMLEAAAQLIARYLRADESARDAIAAAERADSAVAREAAESGFDSVELALAAAREELEVLDLKRRASEHDQSLAVVRELLAGDLADVDPEEKIELAPAEQAAAEAGRARDELGAAAGVAESNHRTFVRETGPVGDLYRELAPLREAAAISDELNRLTNGDNTRRMKLSIFVLATRLRQVIDAANIHLQKMSDQRYHLVYSGDLVGHGAASGLGIEVHDARTSKVRPTSTLSGGESFCASLSLALGLAEIVQHEAGGKRLETLFIDEGFGTLDAKSLEDVMNVIDSLREGGRSVGLVSHVEELRNRIPAQIQVQSTSEGSTLRVTTG